MANALPRGFAFNEIIDPEKVAFEKGQRELIAQLQEENKILKVQNEILMKIKT